MYKEEQQQKKADRIKRLKLDIPLQKAKDKENPEDQNETDETPEKMKNPEEILRKENNTEETAEKTTTDKAQVTEEMENAET